MEAAAKAAAAAADTPRSPQTRCAVATTSCCARRRMEVLCWWAAYHIKLGVDTIYLYVHDASVVEPKKQAPGVAAPSPLLLEVQARLKALHLERQVFNVPALSHQKGAGTVDVVAMQSATSTTRSGARERQGHSMAFSTWTTASCCTSRRARSVGANWQKLWNGRASTFNLNWTTWRSRRTHANIRGALQLLRGGDAFQAEGGPARHEVPTSRSTTTLDFMFMRQSRVGRGRDTAPFLSYWNGKSAGRLAEPGEALRRPFLWKR